MRALALLTLSLFLAGCEGLSLPSRSAAPPAATAPADRPTGGEVMALVNGKCLYMDDLQDLLLASHGPAISWVMITCEVTDQQAAAGNLTVSEEDVRAEEDLLMGEFFDFVPDVQQRYKLRAQDLARRNISPRQWKMMLRRNALLRKLAAPRVTVSEAELAQEFEETYGAKVVVRHIQTASLREVEDVLAKLRAGEDFADLAKRLSANSTARDGGLLPPIGKTSRLVPPIIAKAAWALTKPGELSAPVQVGTAYHVLRLEKIVQAAAVAFANVKDKVAASAKTRKTQAAMNDLLRELTQAAKIDYVNPVLRALAQEQPKP